MASNGIVTIPCRRSVEAAVEELTRLLEAKNIKLFAVIDHSGEAEKAGLRMPNTKLPIFGNPAAGTPLMLASPTAALDLPLKILVWDDAAGKTWISYNDAEYLQRRHGFPAELAANIAAISVLAARAAEAA